MVLAAGFLAGCGSSGPAPTGVLTNADMPASLRLEQSQSDTAQNLAKAFDQTYPGCTSHYAVFTVGGRAPSPVLTGATIYPEVFSGSATCSGSDKAGTIFQGVSGRLTKLGAVTVGGIGDGAFLTQSNSKTANSYVIFWWRGVVLASVQLSGPIDNKQISAAETEALARRQVASAK